MRVFPPPRVPARSPLLPRRVWLASAACEAAAAALGLVGTALVLHTPLFR